MQNLLSGTAEKSMYSEAQILFSPITSNTRDFHFRCVICYLKTKQEVYFLLLSLKVCHSFKINEKKNTQPELNVRETAEQWCLRAVSCQIYPHHKQYL